MPMVTVSAVAGQPYRQQITAGNHTFYSDIKPHQGGQDTAPDPHDLLLGALGACTAMTMQIYAQRKGWDLQGVTIDVSETKTPGTPITLHKKIQVKGNLSADQQKTLQTIAEKCPVNKLIKDETKLITSSLDLVG